MASKSLRELIACGRAVCCRCEGGGGGGSGAHLVDCPASALTLSLEQLERATLVSPQPDAEIRRRFASRLHVRYDEQHRPITVHTPKRPCMPTSASPLLASLREGGTAHHKGHPSLTLPRSETCRDLYVVLLNDPYVHRPYAWAITRPSATWGEFPTPRERGECIDLTSDLPPSKYVAPRHSSRLHKFAI